jgi:hypothetical protein
MGEERTRKSEPKTRVNKLGLIIAVALGTVIGYAPSVVLLERPIWLPFVAAAAAIGAFGGLRKVPALATNRPGFLEFLLGTLSSVYLPVLAGFGSLFIYWVFYGIITLLRSLLLWLNVSTQLNPDAFAHTITAIVVFFYSLVTGFGADHLAQQLYPNVSGLKSAFYDTISRRRGQFVGCAVAAVAGLALFLALFILKGWVGSWFFYILLSILFAGISAPLWSLGEGFSRPATEIRVLENLLRASDYDIVRSPKTGKSGVDPLMINVDLLAYNDEQALVVQVKTEKSPTPVDWTAASTLQTAAWAVDGAREQFGLGSQRIEPLMVLMGAVSDESLRAFSQEEGIRIAEIPDTTAVLGALTASDVHKLREMAQRYLGLSDELQEGIASEDEMGEPGGER